MRADRLIGLILILQSRGKMRGEVIARELEVSRRTILRDVEALSAAGVPILAEGGHGGGIWLDESYRSSLTGLVEGELRAPILGADASLAEDLGMGEAYRLGRGKLIAAPPRRFEPAIEMVQRRILVDSRLWWREAVAESFLAPLQEAVFADALVQAEYRHFDDSVRSGLLEPYGLVAKAGLGISWPGGRESIAATASRASSRSRGQAEAFLAIRASTCASGGRVTRSASLRSSRPSNSASPCPNRVSGR